MGRDAIRRTLLVRGGRIYDHDGDVDQPPTADLLVVDGRIAAIRDGIGATLERAQEVPELRGRSVDEVIDARDKLVIPGFVNAHYHSHDVLLKGRFETIPLDLWFLSALPPNYPKRSTAEIRARTLLGAIECLRGGITTVQDFATISPYDEEHLEAMLQAYEDVGIRCVFALQIADIPAVDSTPFWDEVFPPEQRAFLSGAAAPLKGIDPQTLVQQVIHAQRRRHPRISWALGPSSPERCSVPLLHSIAEFSAAERLPVYTHIYESKGMTLIGRQKFARYGGSLVNYLKSTGLLSPLVTLAHSVWMTQEEIATIAQAGANVVLNPLGNLKTRSGVPPIPSYMEQGVKLALGCDNCSCGDAQNMFEAMKMFAALAAICDPEPGPPTAAQALRCATVGGAQTAHIAHSVGALKVGMAADMAIIDLDDPSFVPMNSAARQLVFTEAGRGVETVIVDGQVVVRNRKVTTVDERALKDEVAGLMPKLNQDVDALMARNARLMPYIMEAYRRTLATDIGVNRYVAKD